MTSTREIIEGDGNPGWKAEQLVIGAAQQKSVNAAQGMLAAALVFALLEVASNVSEVAEVMRHGAC